MEKVQALKEILRECRKLPESERNDPDKIAFFALGILQDRPDLKFEAAGDPYQVINAYLGHELLQKKD
jgi:hypothetical protein